MSDKAKKRRSGRDAKYYANQFIVTERNKRRREAQRKRKFEGTKATIRAFKRHEKHVQRYEANKAKRAARADKKAT